MGFLSKLLGKKEKEEPEASDAEGEKPVVCPTCASQMQQEEVNGISVNLCANCGGFFMDKDAFQNVVNKPVGTDVHALDHEDSPDCSGCKGKMAGTEVEGAEIEICPECDVVHAGRAGLSSIAEAIGNDGEDGSEGSGEVVGFLLRLDRVRNVHNSLSAKSLEDLAVDSVFVLSRGGLLITSYTVGLREEMDKDIVGGMMVAITNFVQTSFKGVDQGTPLESIRFKGTEIAFEHGKYLIVALQIRGSLEQAVREAFASALTEIESKYDSVLQDWDGNLGDLKDMVGSFQNLVVPVTA